MASKNTDKLLLDKIQLNWFTLLKLVDKIDNTETREGAKELCEALHDRFAVCPASSKIQYIGAFCGGLVWNSLNITRIMKDMRAIFQNGEEEIVSNDSLIVLGLFHDLGKLGNETEDYYLPQSNDYYKKRGIIYEINQNLTNIPVFTRSIWWLNRFNIWLNEKELHAISSLNVKNADMISFNPSLKDPWEAYLLQCASRGTCLKYAGFLSLLET